MNENKNRIQLKIMSYNLWFDKYMRNKRLNALIDLIEYHEPDVICLQEVISDTYVILQKYLEGKWFPGELKYKYGCVIFSKYPIIESSNIEMTSNMGRSLTICTLDLTSTIYNFKDEPNDISKIVIVNSHFESEFGINNVNKLIQFEITAKLMNEIYENTKTPVILCADTNVTEYDSNKFDSSFIKLNDSWIMNGKNKNKEYTYDGNTNKNLKLRNINIRSRIDRILYSKDDTLNLLDYELIMDDDIEPSDHYGIMSTFDIVV